MSSIIINIIINSIHPVACLSMFTCATVAVAVVAVVISHLACGRQPVCDTHQRVRQGTRGCQQPHSSYPPHHSKWHQCEFEVLQGSFSSRERRWIGVLVYMRRVFGTQECAQANTHTHFILFFFIKSNDLRMVVPYARVVEK